jgi:hypothetical protein
MLLRLEELHHKNMKLPAVDVIKIVCRLGKRIGIVLNSLPSSGLN